MHLLGSRQRASKGERETDRERGRKRGRPLRRPFCWKAHPLFLSDRFCFDWRPNANRRRDRFNLATDWSYSLGPSCSIVIHFWRAGVASSSPEEWRNNRRSFGKCFNFSTIWKETRAGGTNMQMAGSTIFAVERVRARASWQDLATNERNPPGQVMNVS